VTRTRARNLPSLDRTREALSKVEWRSPRWLWGPVVLQMAIIFAASSIPNLGPLPGGISDTSGHSIGYGLLAGLLLRALAVPLLRGLTWRRASSAIILSTVYGELDQFHQSFVPGRYADRQEKLADCTGAALGVAAAWHAGAARRWGILDSSS
jgi:VanZ family protein